MKKITHPDEGYYGTGNKAWKYRCGPYMDVPNRGQMDGGKDLGKNATNSMGKIDKMEMDSPNARANSKNK